MEGYDVRAIGMGTEEEAFDEYGAIINKFDTYSDEVDTNNEVSFLYTFFSSEMTGGDNMNIRMHNTILKPTMKEIKGYVKFYVFDCNHPGVESGDI